jgi:hypothetical protein
MDFRKHVFGLALTTALIGVAVAPAQAQLNSGSDRSPVVPASSRLEGLFHPERCPVLAPLDVSFGLVTTIAWQPLR